MKKRGNPENLKPFVKGVDPRRNIKGQPPIAREIKELLTENLSPELMVIELNKLIKAGNVKAIEMYLERVYGKVTQPTDLTTNGKDITTITFKNFADGD